MKKRILSLTMMFIILVSTISPVLAVQATSTIPEGYSGIYNASDLDAVRNNPSGNYILMNDIDLSVWGEWQPIGTFRGAFDGNGYSVTNLTITSDSGNIAGLFSRLYKATVKNLSVSGSIYLDTPTVIAGGIAGKVTNTRILNCTSFVEITYRYGTPTDDKTYFTTDSSGKRGTLQAGGIIGSIESHDTEISECANYGKISGISQSAWMMVGGVVGNSFSNGKVRISNCYNAADLEVETGCNESSVGGLFGGEMAGEIVQNCYNIGTLTCKTHGDSYVGGIGGCGGSTNISNCYYLSNVDAVFGGQDINAYPGATSCSSAAMQRQDTFAGFDFTSVWKMGDGSYPYPTLIGVETDVPPEDDSVGDVILTQLPAPQITISKKEILPNSTAAAGTTVVSWNAVEGATKYVVSWIECGGDYTIHTDTTEKLSYTLKNVSEGQYLISVCAKDKKAVGGKLSNLLKLAAKDGNYASNANIPVLITESETVTKGEIRYVCQTSTDYSKIKTNSPFYFKSYWEKANGHYSSKSKCSTCCLSMALSYLGINALPKDLREVWNDKNFYYQVDAKTWKNKFDQAGIIKAGTIETLGGYSTKSKSAFDKMYSNFETDSQYSPVLFYVRANSNNQHWEVIIDDLGNGKYLVVDPWASSEKGIIHEVTFYEVNGEYKMTYNGYKNSSVCFIQYHLTGN